MPRELEGGVGIAYNKVDLLEEYRSERVRLLEEMKERTDLAPAAGGYIISASEVQAHEIREDGFINQLDAYYLKQYAIEHLIDLLAREKLNRFDGLMTKQT